MQPAGAQPTPTLRECAVRDSCVDYDPFACLQANAGCAVRVADRTHDTGPAHLSRRLAPLGETSVRTPPAPLPYALDDLSGCANHLRTVTPTPWPAFPPPLELGVFPARLGKETDEMTAQQTLWFARMGLDQYKPFQKRINEAAYQLGNRPAPTLPPPDPGGMRDTRYQWPEAIAMNLEGEIVSIPSVLESQSPAYEPPPSGPVEQGLLTANGQLWSFIHNEAGAELRWNPQLRGSWVRVHGWKYPDAKHLDVSEAYLHNRKLRLNSRWLAMPDVSLLAMFTPIEPPPAPTETATPTPTATMTPTSLALPGQRPPPNPIPENPPVEMPPLAPPEASPGEIEGATPENVSTIPADTSKRRTPTPTPRTRYRPEAWPLDTNFRDRL